MRIAYISLHWPRTLTNSVGKKILRTMNAWQASGHETRLFMHTLMCEPTEELLPGEVFVYHAGNKLQVELSRVWAARRLVEAVYSYHPDIIYFRYGMYVFPIHDLAGVAPVIEDVTTNDLIQHQELGRVYTIYNRLTRGILLRRVNGLVAISHELARSAAFAPYKIPTSIIANGIDLENFEAFPAPANAIPRLAFIGTPTVGFAAHGIDKLVTLAGLCPDLRFDVIGYEGFSGTHPLPENITFHGFMPPDLYLPLLANSDAAISSLAFHRVGMQEQSPLKSREYLAVGLPMVVPYIDTDLDDLDCDFLLKIPNCEDNVQTHAAAIRDFSYRMRGKRVDRSLVAPRIDTRIKELKRLEFFQRIVGSLEQVSE
jgi:glycosyltransferase involved in cell wall biosynthesis